MYRYKVIFIVAVLALSSSSFAQIDSKGAAYPGTISVMVDARDVAHRLFHVTESIPVSPGTLTLLYPQWIPGFHRPEGTIDKLVGLRIYANKKPVNWVRDPGNVYAFKVSIPAGVKTLEVGYQVITARNRGEGRVVMTPAMFDLPWVRAVLYPKGYDVDQIQVKASLSVPVGWKAFSSLDVESARGQEIHYKPVSFYVLADSPVFAGRYTRVFNLDTNAKSQVRLNVVADDPKFLNAREDHLMALRGVVTQADKLFGARHFDRYDFLLSLSKHMATGGLEHHRSSENGHWAEYFLDWDPKLGTSSLLPHEYLHSWNGKFRMPKETWAPNFNIPVQNDLLWVYEGLTDYWDIVLGVRSGLLALQSGRDHLAETVAHLSEGRPGRRWRNLQDTTNAPIIDSGKSKFYASWERDSDYYAGGDLLWLDVDERIRQKSGGTKSLDDFAKLFFGMEDRKWIPKLYTFEDVVAALNSIVHEDWTSFLRAKLDDRGDLLTNIEASGWRLVFKDYPTDLSKAFAARMYFKRTTESDFLYSLGFTLGKEGNLDEVLWDSPAFKAGLGSGMSLIAVNGFEISKGKIEDAIRNAQSTKEPITLLIKDLDEYRNIDVDYTSGLRYPHLERIEGKTDYLSEIFLPLR